MGKITFWEACKKHTIFFLRGYADTARWGEEWRLGFGSNSGQCD